MTLAYPYPIQSSTRSFGASTVYGQQQDEVPAGFMGINDMKAVQRAAGANMSIDIGAGVAYLSFGTPAAIGQLGGLRRCSNDATSNSGTSGSLNATDWIATFAASDATNPRIDSVYLKVRDSNLDAGGSLDAKFQVVTGTATAGATLDNRTGVGAAPSNAILICDVLIPATATTVTTANIRDRRQLGPNVNPPTFGTVVDQVTFEPVMGIPVVAGALLGATNAQAACAMWLPRRIVAATKLKWAYRQTATPTTGNWNIAVCDSSGRPIVATGVVAYTGIANTNQVISQTIAATTFEAGIYWVLFGHTLSAGASPTALVASYKAATAQVIGINQFAYLAAGTGTTFPSAINGSSGALTDAGVTPVDTQYGVPVIGLSVG